MVITVDTREPNEIKEYIDDEGGEWEEEHLSTGDFLVDDMIIERKVYGDFIGRLTQSERDIWQQILAMENAADELGYTPELLLEGEWAEALRWSDLTPKEVTMALGSIKKMGIGTIHLVGPRATAQYLVKMDDGSSHDIGSIRDTPSVPDELMPRYLTEGFPGVGSSRAEDLLREFGTFKAIVNSEKDELTKVDGIGDATAEKITQWVEEPLPDDV